MTASQLHVVFGAGQVGSALVDHLAAAGKSVRVISLHRPPRVPEGVDARAIDITRSGAAVSAAEGASVIYQCLNAPYTDWPEKFPPLQRAVIEAATQTGARLVSLENVYGYGPTDGAPMTELLPLVATSAKGRARAAMNRELVAASAAGGFPSAIGRASDFFGPGATQTTLGRRVFENALANKRADFVGDPGLLHTYSYVPDIAAGLAVLGADHRAVGQVWHLPGPETLTTRGVLAVIGTQIGHSVKPRRVPTLPLRLAGIFSPMARGLAEMAYQFEQPFVLDTTKFESTFGQSGTTLEVAIKETIAWYRAQGTSS